MKVIVPNELSLVECSVKESKENDGEAWDISKTYTAGVLVNQDNTVYQSLDNNNTGNSPGETYSGTDAKWKKIGATTPYKMFDAFIETQTVAPAGEPLTFTVPFNRATAFAMFNLEGEAVHIVITDDDAEEPYYDETFELIKDINRMSAFEYFYDYIEGTDTIIRTNLSMPIVGTMSVEITSSSETHQVKVGQVIVGRDRYIGDTKYDAEIGISDYSRKTTDEFGVTSLVRRSFAKRATLPLYLHPDELDAVAGILQSIRAIPCVFECDNSDNGYAALMYYGWLEDWRLVIAGPNETELNLEIQGMI